MTHPPALSSISSSKKERKLLAAASSKSLLCLLARLLASTSSMGFPVGYSEMPKLVLHLLSLLSHLRRLSSCLLRLTGLDIDTASAAAADDHDLLMMQYHHHDLDEHSPAVRFDSLSSLSTGGGEEEDEQRPEGCAVCLGDFDGAAEVRRARGCRHVFHRGCIDRWAAHGHRTCPLCRSPFLPPMLLPLHPLPAS